MAIMSLFTFPLVQGSWISLRVQSNPQMIEKEDMTRLLCYWDFYDASIRSEIVNLNATVNGFGEDPKAALEWVQQNTRWVPCVGHLKNPGAAAVGATAAGQIGGWCVAVATMTSYLAKLISHYPMSENL